jgi:hypothetical protein
MRQGTLGREAFSRPPLDVEAGGAARFEFVAQPVHVGGRRRDIKAALARESAVDPGMAGERFKPDQRLATPSKHVLRRGAANAAGQLMQHHIDLVEHEARIACCAPVGDFTPVEHHGINSGIRQQRRRHGPADSATDDRDLAGGVPGQRRKRRGEPVANGPEGT